jgi:hypothetical protein
MLTNIVDFSTKKIGKFFGFSSAILTNFAICWGKNCHIFDTTKIGGKKNHGD